MHVCAGATVCAHVHVYALRIVSRGKILCFKNTFIIIVINYYAEDWKTQTQLCQTQICISTERLFPHCFGTFSASSFEFHFVLTKNNLKITGCNITTTNILSHMYVSHNRATPTTTKTKESMTITDFCLARAVYLSASSCVSPAAVRSTPPWASTSPMMSLMPLIPLRLDARLPSSLQSKTVTHVAC